MARKLTFTLALLVLVTVFTGASFANIITPMQITFSGGAPLTAGPNSVGIPTTVGGAYQFQPGPLGTFSTGGGLVAIQPGHGPTTFPNSVSYTFDIGTDILTGSSNFFSYQDLGGGYFFLKGFYTVSSSTSGFANTGFPTGAVVPIDFLIAPLFGKEILSAGELLPTPEPGTIALVGSGLLAAAGMLRRKR